MSEEKKDTAKSIMDVLDQCYAQVLIGVPKVSKPVEQLANEYLEKYADKKEASKALVKNQIIKCSTSGFVTGFGGLVTLPVTLPANITSVIYVQMRMIAAIAYINGFELDSDETQTFVYACLAGVSVNTVVKQTAVKFGVKFSTNLVKKIPGKTLTKINQKVGFRFLTKFGSKGLINIGKLVPVAGAVVGGGVDLVETKIIANRANKWFAEGDVSDDKYTEAEVQVEDYPDIDELNPEVY